MLTRGFPGIPPALVQKLAASVISEALTGRELEVLTLLVRGKSNKEMAPILFISETTRKTHRFGRRAGAAAPFQHADRRSDVCDRFVHPFGGRTRWARLCHPSMRNHSSRV